jgi:hypothetical protein
VGLPFDLVRVRGDLAYVSGHGPFYGDRLLITGRVGAEVSVEQAYHAARATGLSILASLKRDLGDLNRVIGGAVARLGAGRAQVQILSPRFDESPVWRGSPPSQLPLQWRGDGVAVPLGVPSPRFRSWPRLACRSVPGSAKAWPSGPERLL